MVVARHYDETMGLDDVYIQLELGHHGWSSQTAGKPQGVFVDICILCTRQCLGMPRSTTLSAD